MIDKLFETINKLKWIQIFTDLKRRKWTIFLFSFMGGLFALAYVLAYKQKETAHALIYAENRDEVVELINSDVILTKLIKDLKLDIISNSMELPILGQLYKKYVAKNSYDQIQLSSLETILKKFSSRFNWSDKSIQISMLEVPKENFDKTYTLIVNSKTEYSIPSLYIKGKVGKQAISKDKLTIITVKEINAEFGSRFKIEKQSLPKALGQLKTKIIITTNNSKTNFIHITMLGADKVRLLENLNYLLLIITKKQPNSLLIKSLLDGVTVVDWGALDVPSKKNIEVSWFLFIGLTSGLLFGISVSLLFSAFFRRTKITSPEKLEKIFDIPVYAIIPFSKKVKLVRATLWSKRQKILLAIATPDDPVLESLRSLRTSLYFAISNAKNNIVTITGSSPKVGKSFVASNFSAVLGLTCEKKVLLIDADMRRGYLHDLLNKNVSPGLKELIDGSSTLEEVIHTIWNAGADTTLDIITRGSMPFNSSDLLMHSNFENILSKVSKFYDLIIIDAPPINDVSDAAIICKNSGLVFMVVRSGCESNMDIQYAISRLKYVGLRPDGFIFNGYEQGRNSSLYANRYISKNQ